MDEKVEKVENPIEKLEHQIKELTFMVKTMVDNKKYKTQACQRRAAREYYARNKDTMRMKIQTAINNRKRRERKKDLKNQAPKEQEQPPEQPQPQQTTQTPFLGY
jgi:hypothetical protein